MQTALDPPNSEDGASSSSRLFAKLTRSPTSTSKHKITPSVGSTGSDSVPEQLPIIPLPLHSQRYHKRPSIIGRNPSAPVVPTVSSITTTTTKEVPLARAVSDGKRSTSGREYGGRMLDMAMTGLVMKPPGSSAGRPSTGIVGDALSPPMTGVPNFQYQQLHELASKRIATLEYLRQTHEGQRFWFNTVQFSKADISRLPSYSPNRLARRATKYMLLGLSVPAVLDVHPQPHPSHPPAANAALALEVLRSLNTLLSEFESYVQLHPSDGSSVSSLSRARIPQMFKRAATTSRPRKSSGAPDFAQMSQISPPAMPEGAQNPHASMDASYTSNTFATSSTSTLVNASPSVPLSGGGYSASSSFPPPGPADAPNSTVLPNEGPYTHLLTPPLPFLPDFYSVFATLCDVLIDVYQRILQMVNTPTACTQHVAETFAKADARIRKIMVGGLVRDFESAAREHAKRELTGVQKIVLGGLMGA